VLTYQNVIKIAKSQKGRHEGRDKSGWNNQQPYSPAVPGLEWSQGQPWCATFASWVAMQAACADLYPRTASCDVAAEWFKQHGRWSAYPALGAQVFFGTPDDLTHTGIVVSFDDTFVRSVEGNTNDTGSAQGDGVYENQRARRSSHVVGYGVPRFPDGVVSADPIYAGEKPRTVAGKPAESALARMTRIAGQRMKKIRNLRKRLTRK
jgi:hypothetical protein